MAQSAVSSPVITAAISFWLTMPTLFRSSFQRVRRVKRSRALWHQTQQVISPELIFPHFNSKASSQHCTRHSERLKERLLMASMPALKALRTQLLSFLGMLSSALTRKRVRIPRSSALYDPSFSCCCYH